jgi:uncharacterized protein DUF2750
MLKSEELKIRSELSLEERQGRRSPLHANELANIQKMDANARYIYFIKKICDTEEVWALFDDGGLQSFLYDEKWCIPFWTHENIARELLGIETFTKNLQNPKFLPIPMDNWIDEILWADMQPENIHLFVQPVPKSDAKIISVDEFLKDFTKIYSCFFGDFDDIDDGAIEETVKKWYRRSVVKPLSENPKRKLP